MNLYCDQCGINHAFGLAEVERVVYGLQAAFADINAIPAKHEAFDGEGEGNPLDRLVCLQVALQLAEDPKVYRENTRRLVRKRKANE